MTTEEIIRAIRVIRHSSKRERNAGRLPSINRLAQETGLQRQAFYRIASGERGISSQSQRTIAGALQKLSPYRAG